MGILICIIVCILLIAWCDKESKELKVMQKESHDEFKKLNKLIEDMK